MEKKTCSKCGRELSLTNDFYEKRKSSKDGFRGVCRECRGGQFLDKNTLLKIQTKKLEEVNDFVNKNSTSVLIDKKYINVDTKMSFKCQCGEIFKTTFYNFKNRNKRTCNKCTNQEPWDKARIENYLKTNSNCELVDYHVRNYRTIIKLKCKCGSIFETNINGFKRKKNKCCNQCSEYKYYSIEDVDTFVKNNSNCLLISSVYKGIESPLKFKCECGEHFETSFVNFKKQNKRHCDKCGDKMNSISKLYSYEEVRGYIENNSDCKLISDKYIGCYEKLELLCSCGNVFKVSFDKFKNQGNECKRRCNKCSNKTSKPEIAIAEFLKNNNIDFETEYRFKDCKYKKTLPFDFYLNNNNVCIEYDGEFHYKETSLGNNLKLQKERDKIKDGYCRDNGITLIRIPYWEFKNDNYKNILKNKLRIC